MNKDELRWMLAELMEKNTVIRGNAQLALECDHPKWAKKYISSIILHIDKITALTSIITDLFLNEKNDDSDSDKVSASTAALAKISARAENIKLH
jgi:hypothetical protein